MTAAVDTVLNVNVTGTLFCCQLAAQRLADGASQNARWITGQNIRVNGGPYEFGVCQ